MARARRRRSLPPPVPEPRAARRWPFAVGVIALVALGIRLFYLSELRSHPFFALLIGDSLQFDILARRIVAGEPVTSDVFYQGQLYPYLLALAYAAFDSSTFAVRVVQAVLGAASCALIAVAGRRFFDDRAGLVAAGLLAFYPPAIFFDGLIHKSSVDLFLVALLLVALGSVSARSLLLAGVALGALSWNRENARVLYPALAAWFLLAHRDVALKGRALRVAVFTVGMAAVLIPVAIRNARASGELTLTTSQSGPNFYIGNHKGASGGYEPLLPGRGNALFEREDAVRVAQAAAGRTLSPGEVSDYWWKRSLTDIRDAPGAWLRLLMRKLWLTLSAHEPIDTESLDAYVSSSVVLRALRWFTFGAVMGLAAAGAWLTRERWRALLPLYVTFALLAASVVLFFVFARYRFPLVPVAMLFAGAGAAGLWERRRAGLRVLAAPLAIGLATALVLHVPIQTSSDQTHANYGTEMIRQQRPAEAVPLLREAISREPERTDLRLSLALALQQARRPDEAIAEFEIVVRQDAHSSEARAGLAMALHQQGRVTEAIPLYRDAIRLKPDAVEAISNLAGALYGQGDLQAAAALLERAVALRPDSLPLRLNLCALLRANGRMEQAYACDAQAAALRDRGAR